MAACCRECPYCAMPQEEGSTLVGIKLMSQASCSQEGNAVWPGGRRASVLRKSRVGNAHFVLALRYFALVPVCPLLAYYLLDCTGVSLFVVEHGLIPQAILGEGFGHVGLCFSFHYVFKGVQAVLKGLRLSGVKPV